MDEEIYMILPPGYEVPKGHVLHLRKALYGLKQAGQQWYKTLKEQLKKFRLVQIVNDPHTFVVQRMFASKLKTLIVSVYVDNLLPMGDQVLVDNFTEFLPKVFKMSAVGEADFFLGLWIERLHDEHVLRIDQHAFVRTILNHFEVPDDATAPTPLSPQEDLAPLDTPASQANPVTRSKYQSVIGSLMYLMLRTRPNFAYVVGKLAHFSANPLPAHFKAVDRVLLYINATKDLYLEYDPDQTNVDVDAFTDADWAQSKPDRKSTSGYLFYINGTAFSWSSKKQSTVATVTNAEYCNQDKYIVTRDS